MLKRRKQLLCFFLTALLLLSNLVMFKGSEVQASQIVQVVLDGRLLSFGNASPQIVNDRTMVPFRAIGEAMGASVSWDPAQNKVTMYLHNRYVILYINNPIMTYGTYTTDSMGTVVYSSTLFLTLDSPPIIINDSTMVPVRAISDGLGAITSWNPQTYSVYITSPIKPTPIATPTPTPSPTPSPSPTPTVNPFVNTSYFEEISARNAQNKYDYNDKFALVYYSSKDQDSIDYVPLIKEAARYVGYKVYGVDADSTYFDNESVNNRISFIFDYINRYNPRYPTLFLVHGKNNVTPVVRPTNSRQIEDYLYDFYYRSGTPSPTPYQYGNTPSPRPTITPTQGINDRWIDLNSLTVPIEMYDKGENFILVYYWQGDEKSDRMLQDIIKPASIASNVMVHGLNASTLSDYDKYNRSWWGRDAYGSGVSDYYPTVFLVNNYGGSTRVKFIRDSELTSSKCNDYFNEWKNIIN